MHLLPTSEIRLDDGDDAVDLGLPPGDVLVLSFADSDLSAIAAAAGGGGLAVRLASLRRLRHPLSVDLLIEKTVANSRFVLVRCLGGLDYWRYGVEQLAASCRAHGVALAVLPGDDRSDARLAEYATVPPACAQAMLDYFHAGGGAENMRRLLARAADHLDAALPSSDPAAPGHLLPRGEKARRAKDLAPFSPRGRRCRQADEGRRDTGDLAPLPLPSLFVLGQDARPSDWREALAALPDDRALVPILVYRSGVAAGDTAMADAISAALAARGHAPLVLALTSLKDATVAAELAALIASRKPALIVTTTAFSARDGAEFVLDAADCTILQAVPVGSAHEAWQASPRGLSAVDLAMQVALPEFDGRLGAIPVAFKADVADPATGLSIRRLVPDTEGIAQLADLASGWISLSATPVAERRLALVMSDYPARGGRAGFAVGLDTPASVAAIGALLAGAAYTLSPHPEEPRSGISKDGPVVSGLAGASFEAQLLAAPQDEGSHLMASLTTGPENLAVPLATYRDWLATIPATAREALIAAHGEPAPQGSAFHYRVVRNGNLTIALQPPRDATPDRKAVYHDPDAPPGHAYLAFYLGLREILRIDALIHLGTHGTTEWLPGKAVGALGLVLAAPGHRRAAGDLPLCGRRSGEAAPAKRRLSAITLGHLPPQLAQTGAAGEVALLRDLVEEFSQAQVMDPRRADIVAREIRDRAKASGLSESCGVTDDLDMSEALTRLDAHLCDIAELPFRDGLHVFGQAAHDPISSQAERTNLLRALDGRFVPPGPAGSPHRGRAASAADRSQPLDARSARHPDAGGGATWCSGGEGRGRAPSAGAWRLSAPDRDGPLGLSDAALRRRGYRPCAGADGCRTALGQRLDAGDRLLDHPAAKLAQPRLDVTIRISGAFRDTFPGQIALLDAAARAVAALDEPDAWNEPAAARRRGEAGARIFGAAPGRYGAATADRALDGDWTARRRLGAAYLSASSHAYGGVEGAPPPMPVLPRGCGRPTAFVHVSDTAGRDILEASSAADVIGGFAAALATLGGKAALYSLDSSNPELPRARTLPEDIARIVHGRLTHPRWIAAHLAHGWRGAAELAEAVDTLFVFAASTDAVSRRPVRRGLPGLLRRSSSLERAGSRQCARRRLDPLAARGGAATRFVDKPAQFGRGFPLGARGGGMSALPQPALRRGWCPSTLKPMETGDGLLVRLHPSGGC